jgi:hypothetical protein
MDPLSVAGCVVTLGEIAVKSVRLIAMIESLLSIPDRTSELIPDIENLRIIEVAIRSFLSCEHSDELRLAMVTILDERSGILSRLETLLLPLTELYEQGAVMRSRTLGLSKARKVKGLRERIAEIVGALSLYMIIAST